MGFVVRRCNTPIRCYVFTDFYRNKLMLVGHFAVAFVGKRVEPKLSLGTLTLAAMVPDILWPVFTLAGLEYVGGQPKIASDNILAIPFSHSLAMDIIWAVLFAGLYFLLRHYTRGALILFAAVLSHWLLDSISHKHILAPGVIEHFGLGLWRSLPATIIVEGGFWLVAIIIYVRTTHSQKRLGTYAFWPVIPFLTLVWITNVKSGPPPPKAVIGSLIFFLLLIAWAYWIDRLRPADYS
jgi:hypothetical protein